MNQEQHYRALLSDIVRKFNSLDLAQIMSCFTHDVVVRYNDLQMEGAETLQAFLGPRFSDLRDYHLEKTLRTVSGNTVGVEARARFVKRSTGEQCVTTIHEFLDFDGDYISRWDYVGHLTQAPRPSHS